MRRAMTESADHPSCGCSRSEPVRICVVAVLVFRFWGTGIDFACHILVHVPGLPTMNAKLIGVYIITPGWIQGPVWFTCSTTSTHFPRKESSMHGVLNVGK